MNVRFCYRVLAHVLFASLGRQSVRKGLVLQVCRLELGSQDLHTKANVTNGEAETGGSIGLTGLIGELWA